MRAKMLRVHAPPDAVDVVGTGGDASGSFNISTCAASSSARARSSISSAHCPTLRTCAAR
jgi:anthranilate phosphoribosyltransferase